MINFDNIKLTKKFFSIFVGILSLLLIVTITLTVRSSFAVNSSERVVHEVIPAIQSICDVQADFKDTRIYAIKLPTATDEAREQLIKDYKENIAHILQHVEGFKGMIKDNYVNEMKTVVQAYNDITLNELEKAIKAGDLMRANEVIKI
ncbi:MAG: MCP four helix bundle domain-containing protein, partial [Succinivibrio sp.]|nr:MCP four helix bundle domain-containing protein [Succinivibrio sp.]